MAALGDLFEGIGLEGTAGPVVAIGALLLAPTILPAIGRVIRPVAVGALRSGMSAYREAAAATSRMVDEARNEIESARSEQEGTPEATHGARGRRGGRAEEAAS